MRSLSRSVTVLAACAVAACASPPSVRTERADPLPTPSSTSVESSVPSDTAPPDNDTPGTGFIEIDTGLDDRLFPELGAPGVDVVSYDVQLDIEPEGGSFVAEVELVVDVDLSLPRLALDAQGFTVDDVTVNASPATFEQVDDELLIDLPGDRSTRVVTSIGYTAAPDETYSTVGLPAGWFRTDDGSYVLNEPDGARRWLPSNDHPSDKATWRFELLVPGDVAAVANGRLVQQGDDESPWIWDLDEPMSTYLVLLAVGDYDVVVDEPWISVDGDEIPIVHVVPAGQAADFEPYFEQTVPQMAFLEELLGPYPLDGYGLAFLDSVPGLAMETQGRSLFSVGDFADGEVATLQHLLLAHELAHQWFGNAVSPGTWSDIWLNESFATYLQWLWLDEMGLTTLSAEADWALANRQNGAVATGKPTLGSMFGYESYDGGAAVVHALRLTIGDDRFFELLRRWIDDHLGTAQTTEVFVELAEEVSGTELDDFLDDWLYATDLPDDYPA